MPEAAAKWPQLGNRTLNPALQDAGPTPTQNILNLILFAAHTLPEAFEFVFLLHYASM
jgi:hypothetical protein